MKIEDLLKRANKHCSLAFKDIINEDMDRAEALTYWLYLSSKLYVLMASMHDIDDGARPLIMKELGVAIEQHFKEFNDFKNKEDK